MQLAVEGKYCELRVDGVLRSSMLSKRVGPLRDQPHPSIAGPSGSTYDARSWQPNRGRIIHRSLGCCREREVLEPPTEHPSQTRSRPNASQVIATVVVVQSFEGFGSAVSPSELVHTVNAA
jgi:hypothetical protein